MADNANWQNSDDLHFITIDFEENANYNFKLNYIDLAFNRADEYYSQEFTVDNENPRNIQVNYYKLVKFLSLVKYMEVKKTITLLKLLI